MNIENATIENSNWSECTLVECAPPQAKISKLNLDIYQIQFLSVFSTSRPSATVDEGGQDRTAGLISKIFRKRNRIGTNHTNGITDNKTTNHGEN